MFPYASIDELCAARAGDRGALERVLHRSRPLLRRYAEGHCASRDVEDAVQESLIAVARHLPGLRQPESFAGWLFRIVRRECQRCNRLAQPFWQVPLGEHLDAPAAATSPDLARDLDRALAALPVHYREIVQLRDVDGLTLDEICAHLELSLQAAKARLHRARGQLRAQLRE